MFELKLLLFQLCVLIRKHFNVLLHGIDLNFEKRNFTLFLGQYLVLLLGKCLNEEKLLSLLLPEVILHAMTVGTIIYYEWISLDFDFNFVFDG